MTNEQILKKAIEKALNNGWCKENISFNPRNGAYAMIFSHDFAKAFWGEKEINTTYQYVGNWQDVFLPAWQYHLQLMVLEKDPIKYLEKFI